MHEPSPKVGSALIRVASLGLLTLGIAVGGRVGAQEPVLVPAAPDWSSNAANQTMVLWPTTARVGLGVTQPVARLQILGTDIVQEPGTGYLVLGPSSSLHMQLDRNEIRVSGPTPETVGALYLQRFGGPISLRSSQDMAQRIVFPTEGGLAIGASDPHTFAIEEGFQFADWPRPSAALAVDGHIYTHFAFADEGRFQKRLRVGHRGDEVPGGAWDKEQSDAVAMIGGTLTAHEIVVHIDDWADDVFDKDYALRSLEETKEFIEENHHLPDVPSQAEIRETGADLAQMNELLLRKVEELTLHAIAQEDRIAALEAKINARD